MLVVDSVTPFPDGSDQSVRVYDDQIGDDPLGEVGSEDQPASCLARPIDADHHGPTIPKTARTVGLGSTSGIVGVVHRSIVASTTFGPKGPFDPSDGRAAML